MAINIPIVTEFVDAGLKSAQGAFANFRTQVGQAEGAMGKLKAGAGAAFDGIKANAASMALGAGTAIAGFALKAIGDFQKLALEVDKFSNSTGLAAEEASRWVEAAGDIGIESNTLTSAFNKMNRAVADNSTAFAELGTEIARTETGATDVNQTFLNTIEALRKVEDPAQRARLATQILGKSWTELSELVEMGAADLEEALASVSDAKIIDENEIAKAKRLREVQDNLGDAFESIALTIGEALLPAVEAVAGPLEALARGMQNLSDEGISLADGPLTIIGKKLGIIDKDTESVTNRNSALLASWIANNEVVREVIRLNDKLGVGLEDVDDALTELKGNVDRREAWRNLIDEIDNVKNAAIEAFVEGTPAAIRESESSLDQLRVELAQYIAETEGIPTEKKTDFLARLETANLQQIEAIFNQLGRPRTVEFRPTVNGIPLGPGETPSEVLGRGNRMATMSNVTVNVQGSVIAENDLVESVRRGLVNAQKNGSGLVFTNS